MSLHDMTHEPYESWSFASSDDEREIYQPMSDDFPPPVIKQVEAFCSNYNRTHENILILFERLSRAYPAISKLENAANVPQHKRLRRVDPSKFHYRTISFEDVVRNRSTDEAWKYAGDRLKSIDRYEWMIMERFCFPMFDVAKRLSKLLSFEHPLNTWDDIFSYAQQ